MKKIILIMILILIPLVYAQGYGGDGCPYGNFPYGNCTIIQPEPQPSKKGGGATTMPAFSLTDLLLEPEITTPYYDVTVKVLKNVYKEGENIESTITIINKGDIPDRDAILIYYLFINNNTITGGKEVFEEIPIGKNILQREINIPEKVIGSGLFIVEYKTASQSPIQVYDGFEVTKSTNHMLILALLLALLMVYSFFMIPTKLKILKKIKNKMQKKIH